MDILLTMDTRNKEVHLISVIDYRNIKSDFLKEIKKNIVFSRSLFKRVKNK